MRSFLKLGNTASIQLGSLCDDGSLFYRAECHNNSKVHGNAENTRESLIINLKMARLHDLAVKTSAGTFA